MTGIERRYDAHGVKVWMAEADGWVMARRPHCVPFVVPREEWDRMPCEPPTKRKEPESVYLCLTCGQTVQPGERHEHSCPVEGDQCGQRGCNVTGLCQA